MEFFDTIKQRKSTRVFTDEPVSDKELKQILIAANAAPMGSARYDNLRISVVKNKNMMEKLSVAMEKMLQDRTKMKAIAGSNPLPPIKAFKPFYGAPVVLIVSHKMHDVQPGIEYTNVGCVCENMHLAATALGLGSCYMWGVFESMRLYPELDASSLLELPEDYMPIMGMIVGHPITEPNEREMKDKIPTRIFE
ncbi:MAG: nitroreductase family protein [Clostridiales bacterium]|nr:nitroreductase family protein [Clostridiales bacterium]